MIDYSKQKPKYEVGQEVWLIDDREICTAIIDAISEDESLLVGLIKCAMEHNGILTGKSWIEKNNLFTSREALIEAQIEYWNKLKLEAMIPRFEGDIKSLNIYQSVITDGSTPTIGDSAIKDHGNAFKLAEQIQAGNKRINEILQENQECPLCGQLSPYLFPIPKECQCSGCNGKAQFNRTNKQEFPYNSTAQLDMLDNVRKMQIPKDSDCKHVSDGKVYLVNSILDDDGLSKCKECGEFYK